MCEGFSPPPGQTVYYFLKTEKEKAPQQKFGPLQS